MDAKSRDRRRNIPKPRVGWADAIVHWLGEQGVVVAFVRLYDRVVPLLFAVFIAAPVGLVILPFFVPKFIRNQQRRRKYKVTLSKERVDRIPGLRRSTNL